MADPASIASLLSQVGPILSAIPTVVSSVSSIAGAFSSAGGLVSSATSALVAAKFCFIAAPLAMVAKTALSIYEGMAMRKLLETHLGSMSESLGSISENVEVQTAHLDAKEMGRHVYEYIEHHSVMFGMDTEGPLIMVYHPGTEWHPRAFILARERLESIQEGKIKHSPMFMIFSSLEVLFASALYLRINKTIPPTREIHVLFPSAHPYVVVEPLRLPLDLHPIRFHGELNRKHKPYVYFNARSVTGSTPLEVISTNLGFVNFDQEHQASGSVDASKSIKGQAKDDSKRVRFRDRSLGGQVLIGTAVAAGVAVTYPVSLPLALFSSPFVGLWYGGKAIKNRIETAADERAQGRAAGQKK